MPRLKLLVSKFGRILSVPLYTVTGCDCFPRSVSCPRWAGSPWPQRVSGGLGARLIPFPVVSWGTGGLLWEVLRSITHHIGEGGSGWVITQVVLCSFISIAIEVGFLLLRIYNRSSQVGVEVIQLVVSPLQSERNRSSFTHKSVKLPSKTFISSSPLKSPLVTLSFDNFNTGDKESVMQKTQHFFYAFSSFSHLLSPCMSIFSLVINMLFYLWLKERLHLYTTWINGT